jgi:hypothetical protein
MAELMHENVLQSGFLVDIKVYLLEARAVCYPLLPLLQEVYDIEYFRST